MASLPAFLPPPAVRDGFGVADTDLAPAPGVDGGVRCGDLVLSPVLDAARAAWSAGVRAGLEIPGLRIAQPVRSSDGRWVVAGWRADHYLAGLPAARVDEVAAASIRFHDAVAGIPKPRFLTSGDAPSLPWEELDVFAAAAAAAFADDPASILSAGLEGTAVPREDVAEAFVLAGELAAARQPLQSTQQIVHADLLATCLFDGSAAPGITDIVAHWRPAGWGHALVLVDGVSFGGADERILDRFDYLPEAPQMLLRAVLYRIVVHILHPHSRAGAWRGLRRTAAVIVDRLTDR